MGGYIGYISGDVSNVANVSTAWNLAFPGSPLSVSAYYDSHHNLIGGSIGVGPGAGITATNSSTTQYPGGGGPPGGPGAPGGPDGSGGVCTQR
jgi:hypothetical protein